MDSNDTIYMPDGDFAIECSEGDVFVESDVSQGDTKSRLTIVCAETCTIKSDININYLELFNDNKCKDDPSKMTLKLDGGRLDALTLKARVQEKAFHVEAATTEDSFICRELLETDGCLQVKINLQLSSCCKVKALSVFIDENSRCLVSAEQSLNEDQCCLISAGDIHHNGRIETENKDSTVLLVSANGDIYMKGTIIAANLILSSKEHTAFRSGCIVTAVGSLVAKMKKLTMEKDSYCHVGTRSGNASLIIDCDEEINLEGSLRCFCKGVCSVECRDKILTKKSFRGEFAVATSQFVASKLLQLEECSLELHEGTFVFTNAHENDVEVHGDIRIIGSKLFGSRRTNNESDQNSLEIEGNNVYLEHSSMSCINSITIYAATNVILDENCSATNNGSIEMQATRIDFKGDLRDFETLSFKSSEIIQIFPSAKIQEGREIQLLTSTAEIFGSISTSDTFKIDVESALFHAEIKQCRNIHIEVDFVIINSGELHAKEIFVKSPIFINCPRNLSQNGEDQSAALIIGGIGTNQIKIEGILLVKIGCCVTGTSIKFESVMQFAFESNSSTIPDKDVLSRWKQTSESSLSKLRNGQGGTELQKLFQVATELPKVVCNLSASSNMCNDIVQLTKHIYEKGINTFDINQVTNVFERAHTLYSNIRSLRDEVKQIVRQKWKVIIKKKDKIKQEAMELLEKAKYFFKDQQDLVEGIQTRTFIHQSESCEQKSHAAILYTFGHNGLCVINGKLSARDDILISGSGLAIKARGLKAIKGMISLQGRDVAATQLDASVIEVTGEDTCLLDINVKEDLTVKSKSGNISNVRSGGKVSIECSDSIHIEQIYAREGNFKARNVCLLDKAGKAKHEFQKLAIESKQLSDIDGLLDTTGAYKDMHVADELGLIVEDQDVIIANRKKCDFNVHVKAASLKIENDVSAKRFVAETTKGELSVSKNVNLQGDSIELKANTDLILNDKAKLEATVDGTSLAAGRDICSSASISSKGSNTLVAKRDIKLRPTTYKTQTARKKSSWRGFRSKTTVTETTHVEKPQICGETNVLKATRNVDIEATDISSKTNTSITAKGDVIIKDRVTETKTTTTDRFLGIKYRSETESLESSHGSQINTDGDVHVESENSDISWIGSSLKSNGNTTEIAEKGNITHKRRKLTNKKSTQGLFFKSDNEKLGITYQNSSSTNQLTSDDIVDIGGSYTIKTKSYESSTNINVGSNMNVKTNRFNIKGEKQYSDDSDLQLSLGLKKTRASAKIGFNSSRKTKYQATSLHAKTLELNSGSVTLSNVVAEVDEIEGNVDHMTMMTNADEESEIHFNTEVGIDVVTKSPDVSVGVGYNNSVKVNQLSC